MLIFSQSLYGNTILHTSTNIDYFRESKEGREEKGEDNVAMLTSPSFQKSLASERFTVDGSRLGLGITY